MSSLKEGSSSTRPPLLVPNNYAYWKTRILFNLKSLGEDVWLSIEGGWTRPTTKSDGEIKPKPRKRWNDEEKQLSQANAKALNTIFTAIETDQFKIISQCVSAKEACNALKIV